MNIEDYTKCDRCGEMEECDNAEVLKSWGYTCEGLCCKGCCEEIEQITGQKIIRLG